MLKPPPDRLYGRRRTHALRARQQLLLSAALPRLRLQDPTAPFTPRCEKLWLEIGFGGGEHALATIAAHPEAGLIAAEVFDQGLCSLLAALVPAGEEATAPLPPNLRLWDADARALLPRLPPASLDRVMLLFPDPWPKARHAKRRFVHPDIVALLASRMSPGAEWRIATDDPGYQNWIEEILRPRTDFRFALPTQTRPPDWPATRYEAKALAAGRQPLYWQLIRS